MPTRSRHPLLLRRDQAALLVVDVQERLYPVMWEKERVEAAVRKLIQGFRLLERPIFATEQYPKGLGPTLPSLRELMGGIQPYEKLHFSCCGVEPLLQELKQRELFQIVLCGIEAHVCVLQTALDMLHLGYQVHVPADAVSSRRELDWQMALERMRRSGVVVTTTESVLFELLELAGTPEFKQIAQLVK
ncbi:MAG: hydrolase [candidate division KSB1 bacterium]|nr:hydrolase [candidate division KSB1 bacterium]